MQLSGRLLSFIGGHEGFVSKWYLDPAQVATIGYGFTWGSKIFRDWWTAKYGRKFKRGDTITQAEAFEVLKLMLAEEYVPPVERKMPLAPINVKEASTSSAYNLGYGSLAWKWATAFSQGQIAKGASLLRVTGTTINKGKTKLPGLVRRRNEEADIAEHNKWPSWVGAGSSYTAPSTHITAEDIKEGQLILQQLGYAVGEVDGLPGRKTQLAVLQFQKDHGTLKEDGILGRATLTALVRTRDAREKGKVITGTGTGTAVTGGTVEMSGAGTDVPLETPVTPTGTDVNIIGDILLWGGLTFIAVGLVYLAWRYRDELNAILRRL